jgi:hypothetical protein
VKLAAASFPLSSVKRAGRPKINKTKLPTLALASYPNCNGIKIDFAKV